MKRMTMAILLIAGLSSAVEPESPTTNAARPRTVVFAIDAGGAMATCFDQVKLTVRGRIHDLNDGQRFNVLVCNDFADHAFRAEPVQVSQTTKDRSTLFLDNFSARGSLVLADFLRVAIKQKANELVLFCDVTRPAEKVQGIRVPPDLKINIVAFDSRAATRYFLNLAKSSGGKIVTPEGKEITEEWHDSPPVKRQRPDPEPPRDEEKGVILKP